MKKKTWTKKMCVILAAVLALGITGCGGSKDDGDTVTLVWAITHANQRDTEIVEKALNKKLETLLPGVQVDLIEQDSDKWTKWLGSGYTMDIAWTGYAYDMENEIRMGAFLPLDDLIAEYAPNIQAEMETYKLDYDTGRYSDGALYAIPNQQPFISETTYLIVPAETVQYLDVAAFRAEMAKSPYTTREAYEILEDYLEAVAENDATDTDFVGKYITVNYVLDLVGMRGYYDVGNNLSYRMWNDDGTIVTEPKLEIRQETDAYKLWVEYAERWQKAGYISPDSVSSGISGSQIATLSGHLNGQWNDFSDENDNEELGMHAVYDSYGNLTSYNINIEPRDGSHAYYEGAKLGSEKTYMVIPSTAKHPEEAIQLLDLMRDEIGSEGNDFLNMVVYGFEKDSEEAKEYGVYHYTLNGDQIHSDEYIQQAGSGTTYGQPHWSVGNVFLTYRTELIGESMKEYAFRYDTETRLSLPELPTSGFLFDASNVVAKVDSMTSVKSEYESRVMCALNGDGTQKLYAEYVSKLKTAGVEKVKEEWEKQYKEFVAQQ